MRYGRPVCNALKVIVASLNRMRHSTGRLWSCLMSLVAEGKARDADGLQLYPVSAEFAGDDLYSSTTYRVG